MIAAAIRYEVALFLYPNSVERDNHRKKIRKYWRLLERKKLFILLDYNNE